MFKDVEDAWKRALVQRIVPAVLLIDDCLFEEHEAPAHVSIIASGSVQLHCRRQRWCKAQGPSAVLSAPDICREWAGLQQQVHDFSAQVRFLNSGEAFWPLAGTSACMPHDQAWQNILHVFAGLVWSSENGRLLGL
jgi:hypothetical protein